MKYYFVYMIQYFISYLKYLINRFFNNKEYDLFEYRKHLFNELNEKYPKKFDNKRILEIGPRDGLDTYRLEKLNRNETETCIKTPCNDANNRIIETVNFEDLIN